ncbi:MAG: RecQ family ATP-dependent DNA helicase [Bacteroidales bacterium]
MNKFQEILKKHWGYDQFRPLQEEIIQSVFEGKDTLGLMPTGGGKSLTFQVPALAMEGVCVVVTPLIALMRDQVENLKNRRLRAACIYSGMTSSEVSITLDNAIYGGVKFLYISPERLSSELFISKFKAIRVAMIVVDEAHCISQWGYDFRPSYLNISVIREMHPHAPVLALTATATNEVVADIQDKLLFKTRNVFRKSFFRPNISYIVRHADSKDAELVHILKSVQGSAIVYTRNRKKTQDVAIYLQRHNISADFYHAGLKNSVKEKKQDEWKKGNIRVMVSTNAFGMGIDKADVRVVIHLDMPDSPEEYFQEAGRAGRDEHKAFAVALTGKQDVSILKRRVSNAFPERDFIKEVYDLLGSFLKIGIDTGFEACREFNLGKFCAFYKLPLIPTNSALHLLELAGYIDYIAEEESRSRILILLDKEELYRLRGWDVKTEELIQTMLRSYTGLFTDYAYIDEEKLSSKINLSQEGIYDRLQQLTRAGVISYVPRKRTPYIVYLQRREEKRYIQINRKIYEDRLERYSYRIDSMINYINNGEMCRSKTLLLYFDETDADDCGICDICIKNKKQRNESHAACLAAIMKILEENGYQTEELLTKLPFEKEEILKSLRELMDDRFITKNEHEAFSLTPRKN